MNKPTEAQKKEVLEWCGFTLRCPPEKDAYGRGIWDYPNGMYGDVELDLNSLFKYAVPKMLSVSMSWGHGCRFLWIVEQTVDNRGESFGDDPALALFGAIWGVIQNEKNTD